MVIGWGLWAVLLMLQNAANTWVSRARNSTSLKYHAIAALFSNGVYFANLFVGVNKITASHSAWMMTFTVVFYSAFTMFGSVLSHYLLMHYVEKPSA